MPKRSLESAARAIVLAASAGLLACSPSAAPPAASVMAPVHRLADPLPAPATTLEYPSATIADETRFVMAAPRREAFAWNHRVEVPRSLRIALEPELVGSVAQATRVLVLPYLGFQRVWQPLTPSVLEPKVGADGKPRVELELTASPELLYEKVAVNLYGYRLEPLALETLESRAVRIPEAARLEFSFGLLEPQWTRDPVRFRLEACDAARCEELFSERFAPAASAGWEDRRISLARFAGRTLRFRFHAERLAHAGAFSLPVWGSPTVYAPALRAPGRRNVILLSVDTLRADHLTLYGHPHDTSPFVRKHFGVGGTVFENAVAAATITTPSHMTIFTGLQPMVTGVVDGMQVLPARFRVLPEIVRMAGLDTAAITEDGWLGVENGFARGFDAFAENRSRDVMAPEGQVEATFAKAKRWLEGNRDKHFFLFLHTFQVHAPYAPPAAYDALFAKHEGGVLTAGSPLPLRLHRDYDREIRYVDDELRALFARLAALGLDGQTVFVLLSDHGEEFLEHGRLEHGTQNYQETVHVPLLLAGPGIPRGLRIATPVGHLDLLPTLLELLGLPSPPEQRARSLVRLIESGGDGKPDERALFSESAARFAADGSQLLFEVPAPGYAVRRGMRKVTRHPSDGGFRYEYYDLARDPAERVNLYPERAHEVADLVALLDAYESDSRALAASLSEAPAGSADTPALRLDPAQQEKLRELGYLE